MIYMIIFCSFLMICAILFLVMKIREYNIQRALQLPKQTPLIDDSFDEAKEIGKFLHSRANACGVYFHHTPDRTGVNQRDFYHIASGEEYEVVQFIRICHLLGCEIVIRQTGTNDLETRENNPEVFAEKIAKMKNEAERKFPKS